MAKLGKLTKLKSAIKRWPSLTKLSRNSSSVSSSDKEPTTVVKGRGGGRDQELHAVFVGKSRRRYLVGSDVVDHPLFQELVDRSSSSSSAGCHHGGGVVVSCEVVLFEHLLWMLESEETQLGSMDELVEFYTCAC
jgi:dihydroxyacetone kinase